MSDVNNVLWRISDWFGDLQPEAIKKLLGFHAELLKFNAKVNLISRNTERDADEAHFADSIYATRLILGDRPVNRIWDIGSGNGFPGLIMAILDPAREYCLVDVDSRKCEFLKHCVSAVQLANVKVHNVKFEALSSMQIECAVSRGFASISKTLLLCNRFLNKGAHFYHLKSGSWSGEIASLPSQLISQWEPHLCGEYALPVSQARRAVVVTRKIK